jgi:hypothetical protein
MGDRARPHAHNFFGRTKPLQAKSKGQKIPIENGSKIKREIKNMPSGGKRPGAGRPKGARNKKRAQRLGRVRLSRRELDAVSRGTTPLEYCLSVMRDPSIDVSRRDRLAIAAMPYCHAKIERPQKLGKKERAELAADSAGSNTEWGSDLLRTQ